MSVRAYGSPQAAQARSVTRVTCDRCCAKSIEFANSKMKILSFKFFLPMPTSSTGPHNSLMCYKSEGFPNTIQLLGNSTRLEATSERTLLNMKNCPFKELPIGPFKTMLPVIPKLFKLGGWGCPHYAGINLSIIVRQKNRALCWNNSAKFLRLFVLYKNFAKTMGFPEKTPAQVPHFLTRSGYKNMASSSSRSTTLSATSSDCFHLHL